MICRIFVFIMFFFCTTLSGQLISRVEYKIVPDSMSRFTKKGDLNPIYNYMFQAQRVSRLLYFSNEVSYFPELMKSNTTLDERTGHNIFNLFEANVFGQKQIALEPRSIGTNEYTVEKPFKFIKYELMDSTMKIGKYICNAAKFTVDKANYIVWFTPEIPVPYGPGIYYGLPGLVLKVTLPKLGSVYASKIELNILDDQKLLEMERNKKIGYEEYRQILSNDVKKILSEAKKNKN